MIKVWVLVLYIGASGLSKSAGGPTTIDNLISEKECQRVGQALIVGLHQQKDNNVPDNNARFSCIEATKVKL